MEQRSQDLIYSSASPVDAAGGANCYVYCVCPVGSEVRLGAIGLENAEVYSVAHQDLAALVHNCPAQPYQSSDEDIVAAWVLAHHRAVEEAWRRWGTVLPMTFNTIIESAGGGATQNLKGWMETEYSSLKGKLEDLVGKAEYGVQVFWDPVSIAARVAETDSEIRTLRQEIETMPPGRAYMYRQKLEGRLKNALEARAAEQFQHIYGRLSNRVSNIHAERVKKDPAGRQMLANLSCLVGPDQVSALEAELDRVRSAPEGLSVRLVGPLPPYSFC